MSTSPSVPRFSVVDLSHPLKPAVPSWPGDPRPALVPHATIEREGYLLHALQVGEHTGTHAGAPAHFVPGGATIDRVPAADLVRPAVVIGVSEQAARDADYRLGVADVAEWERRHGPVPAGCFVLLHTGWDERWPDPVGFLNVDSDGALHFPGFGREAAELLLRERGVTGLGTDTHGIDPGTDRAFAVGRLLAECGGLHLECLANLKRLPPVGALVLVGVMPVGGGSGGPARVLGLVSE